MTERESVNFSIDVMGWFGGVNYREKKKSQNTFNSINIHIIENYLPCSGLLRGHLVGLFFSCNSQVQGWPIYFSKG